MGKKVHVKKWIIGLEILLVGFVAVKILALAGVFHQTGAANSIFLNTDRAMAEPPAAVAGGADAKDATADPLAKERMLLSSLQERERQLVIREAALKEEEKRLLSLKHEVSLKIETLKGLEEKLSVLLEHSKAFEDKRYRDLASVFESTPPAQAGPMLEKLDKKTAAGIIMNMKSKKAGAVWGHISPQKAAEITREITQSSKPQEDLN
jgi:flagellar motility protein MotE (MotC chaperone)